jgi:hypothetical protein
LFTIQIDHIVLVEASGSPTIIMPSSTDTRSNRTSTPHDNDNAMNDGPNGYVVALEGDIAAISTQLRLLPPSSNILTLPALSESLNYTSTDRFDARKFILHVHESLSSRQKLAQDFLNSTNTNTNKSSKLVLVNGGAVSARTACITKIAEELTNGDTEESTLLFNEIVKRGVVGLSTTEIAAQLAPNPDIEVVQPEPGKELDNGHKDNPIEHEKDLAHEEHVEAEHDQGQNGIHDEGHLDEPNYDAAPVSRFSHATDDEEEEKTDDEVYDNLRTTPFDDKTTPTHKQERSESPFGTSEEPSQVSQDDDSEEESESNHPSIQSNPNLVEKHTSFGTGSYPPSMEASPKEEGESETTASPNGIDTRKTPRNIEIGRASVATVHTKGKLKKFQSMSELRSVSVDKASLLRPRIVERMRSVGHLTSPSLGDDYGIHSKSDGELNKKAHEEILLLTGARLSAVNPMQKDQAVDTADLSVEEGMIPLMIHEESVFEPVFPLLEDLVIYFHDGLKYEVFDATLKSYKRGTYPVFPEDPDASMHEISAPPSPRPSHLSPEPGTRPGSYLGQDTEDEGYPPSNSKRNDVEEAPPSPWPLRTSSRQAYRLRLPTSNSHKFIELPLAHLRTAVEIQNAFRSALSQSLPAIHGPVKQFPCDIGADRLWKPVFRVNDGFSKEGQTVDQIVAIGSAEGVDNELYHTVACRVEQLGMKRIGLSKAGNLDIK